MHNPSRSDRREAALSTRRLDANDFLVGIGASAGGLQPLEAFFSNLPPDPSAAFVVVQHLSPNFNSLMVELLQQRTQLPVSLIENEQVLTLNQVYILPPGKTVQLQGQKLLLENRQEKSLDYPIDRLFLSIAKERGDRTIGIVLSGTGRDGTEGLKSISRSGGIALVQSQETAQFGAMPSSPLSSGLVDEILSPRELAHAVCDIIRYTTAQIDFSANAAPLLPTEQLSRILEILLQQEKIDFSRYKTATLHRRIIHRLLLSKASTIEDYINYLSTTPEEVRNLRQDLLIGATQFFRDPDLWSSLQQNILPALLESLDPEQPLRLWVAACSTGEEVYSLAIALYEVMERLGKSNPVKLFATDLDPDALKIASSGIYPNTVFRDLGYERIDRFFKPEGATYHVKKFIRSQVVFASHDLTKNPGFSQMHLISCRNLLIYLQSTLQEQVLKLLHFSLVPEGILVLGPSEHLGETAHAFHSLDRNWKIFRKKEGLRLPISRMITSPIMQSNQAVALAQSPQSARPPYAHLLSEILKLRFGNSRVTCLLINDTYQVLHTFFNSAQLLKFPIGAININLLDLVPPSLKIPLSTALHRARRERQPVLYRNLQVSVLDPDQRLNLWIVMANPEIAADKDQLIVLLEIVPLVAAASTATIDVEFDPASDISQHVQQLEHELKHTRENLQASIEELETANEEQKATNEELLASNEELQSTNEELQSVNEELYTVNAESQERIKQLTELSADVDNLLQSTDIGVVFLDKMLNIRKFTHAATSVFNFRMGDTGRPIMDLVNYLDIDNLVDLLQQVVETQIMQEVEATNLQTSDSLLLRVLPYFRDDHTVDGIVLTFVVIDDFKPIQEALVQSNQLMDRLYQNSPMGLALLNQEMRFVKLNQRFSEIDGIAIEAHVGQSIQELLPTFDETLQSYFQTVLDSNRSVTFEASGTIPGRSEIERTWLVVAYPVDLSNEQTGIGAIVTDITAQKQTQAELLESKTLVQRMMTASSDILTLVELPSGQTTYLNSAIETLLGYTPDEVYQQGEAVLAWHVHPADLSEVLARLDTLAQAPMGEIVRYEYRARHKDGFWRWIDQRNVVVSRDQASGIQRVLGVGTDITDRIQIRGASQNSERVLRTTFENMPIVIFTQDLELNYTWIHHSVPNDFGEDTTSLQNRNFLTAIEDEELTRLKQEVLSTGATCHYEFSLRMVNSPRLLDLTLAAQRSSDGKIIGLTGVGIDITYTKQNEAQLQQLTKRLKQAQQIARIGDWEYDLERGTITWSAEVFRMTGIDPAAGVPSIPEIFTIVHPDDRTVVMNLLEQYPELQQSLDIDIQIIPKNGKTSRHVNIISRSITSDSGKTVVLYGTIMDVTSRKQAEADLERRAFFDALTQLPNRAFFLQHLQLSMSRLNRDIAAQFAVLYLDLDNFKEVNDTMGHKTGDQLLVEMAQRLDDMLRPGDIVSRLGGDEFAILLEQTAHPEAALQVAHRVQDVVSQPLSIADTQISTTSSIGIAFYEPNDPWHSETAVLENADIAMYHAKRQGPGNIALFSRPMRATRVVQAELKASIPKALEQDEFLLHYQPLIDIQRGALIGFEALIRWQHSQQGLLPPLDFLPIVESSNLMPALESWILKKACIQCRQWQQQFDLDPAFRININVSADFLKHASFMSKLHLALEESAIDPRLICLEITENSFIGYSGAVDKVLKAVSELGIKIALDDFGTGYSSLSYLHRLPIDVVKIDQSFIQALDAESSMMSITQGIIGLTHQIGIKVIAEGLETPRQLKLIKELSCDFGQGYLFSHPVDEEDVEQFIQNPGRLKI